MNKYSVRIFLIFSIFLMIHSCKEDIEKKTVEISFQTSPVTKITIATAISGGDIFNDGGKEIIERGVCWSKNNQPTIDDNKTQDGKGIGKFTSNLAGLTENTDYNVRAYATNIEGTVYAKGYSFKTPETVTDIDGNVYSSVTIGTQIWMNENLKVTHYRNGESIPNVTDQTIWKKQFTGAYCTFNNIPDNANNYGLLYNWPAVTDGRFIAPLGWHIPSDQEWNTLMNYLGGETEAGFFLKEPDTTHWQTPNLAKPNKTSGFNALPGGYRDEGGYFFHLGTWGWWWTWDYTLPDPLLPDQYDAWTYFMTNEYGYLGRGHLPRKYGFSVRCIKN